jgi:uncharacterized membrane protein
MANRDEPDDELTTQRIEAFSDGVFAIAITLLILEIKIPHLHSSDGTQSLAWTLLQLWPSYGAYILSFVTIGIYWANHSFVFGRLYKRTDHVFNLLNVLFLLCISFVPFPTAVLAAYMTDARERHTAVNLYALGMVLPATAWFLNWIYASYRCRLIDRRLDPGFVRYLTRQYLLSIALYAGAWIISFWNGPVSLALLIGLTLLYLLPPKKPVYRSEHAAEERMM